ncbi:MAG: hypothetical protein ACO3NM_17425, partial [bacterium]
AINPAANSPNNALNFILLPPNFVMIPLPRQQGGNRPRFQGIFRRGFFSNLVRKILKTFS